MEPPPNANQGPQPAGQPQYPQHPNMPPQYGMQQMPYYPQQKQGMPGWAWALIICGLLFVFMIVGIFALAAIPLITSNTRDARRAEGEQLLYGARDFARVEFSKMGKNPGSFSSAGSPNDFDGKYYSVDDRIQDLSREKARITATPTTASDGKGTLDFPWASGGGRVKWNP